MKKPFWRKMEMTRTLWLRRGKCGNAHQLEELEKLVAARKDKMDEVDRLL